MSGDNFHSQLPYRGRYVIQCDGDPFEGDGSSSSWDEETLERERLEAAELRYKLCGGFNR